MDQRSEETRYRDGIKNFRTLEAAISDLRLRLPSHISEKARSYIRRCSTLAEDLRTLKEKFASTQRGYELIVEARYQRLKGTLTSSTVGMWLDRWEEVVYEAIDIGIPDVAGDRAI